MVGPWHVLILLVVLALWIAPIVIAAQIGNRKGHQALGVVLGLLLGWLGVIIIAFVRPARTWPREESGWPPRGQPWPGQQPGWPQQDQPPPDAR